MATPRRKVCGTDSGTRLVCHVASCWHSVAIQHRYNKARPMWISAFMMELGLELRINIKLTHNYIHLAKRMSETITPIQ